MAFLSRTMETEEADTRYHRVDTFVHEFCKLFGRTGGPKYVCGVLSFPEFLELQVSQTKDEQATNLHRQVGSQYFVTASNACKILFSKTLPLKFLSSMAKILLVTN